MCEVGSWVEAVIGLIAVFFAVVLGGTCCYWMIRMCIEDIKRSRDDDDFLV